MDLKQQFWDESSANEPGEDTNGSEAYRFGRNMFGDSAKWWSPASPTPMTSEELSNA